jgi:hypothetical protein
VIDSDKLIDNQANVLWKKGASDGATFQYRELDAAENHWHPAGTFLSSPSPVDIPAHPQSREVEIVGRYIKGNQQIGDWSQPYRLIIKPTID